MEEIESHKKVRSPYNNRWCFFICNELDCGFFYHANTKPVKPYSSIEVFVVVLGKKVKLLSVGTGEEGYQTLIDQGMENSIFPVNLFNRPFQIDVKVSGTVTPELHERWLKLIAFYKMEPFVSQRKEHVRFSDNGRIVQHRLCTTEEFQQVLEQEAEKRTSNPASCQPDTWRLATNEEKTLS
jgi:hypothetical protein